MWEEVIKRYWRPLLGELARCEVLGLAELKTGELEAKWARRQIRQVLRKRLNASGLRAGGKDGGHDEGCGETVEMQSRGQFD